MLSRNDVVELASTLYDQWLAERKVLDRIDLWYRWRQEKLKLPRAATAEMKMLEELSRTPWLGLVVTSTAQLLYVDGWRSLQFEQEHRGVPRIDRPVPGAWQTWQANDLDRRQVAIHRAALAYGYSFATILPGEQADGGRAVTIKGKSPRKMFAVYQDPANDEWPMYALEIEASGGNYALRFFDEEHRYFLTRSRTSDKIEFVEPREHGAGVTPVARFANQLDLEGRAPGEVEPFIPLARRINKTDHDLLVAQHFNSTVVRTVAGLSQPDSDQEKNQQAVDLGLGRLLVAEDPDTKFGSLPATPLEGLISAKESNVETLSAVSQTPTHELTGKMINLSAEALAAAKATQINKVRERQHEFGGTWESALRLGESLKGNDAGAADFGAHVTWQDLESRSLSQAVDALGKAAQMLGVPVEALWARIPGTTASDVEEWHELAAEQAAQDPQSKLADALTRQGQPPA